MRLLRVALQSDPLSLEVQREIGQVQVEAWRYEDAINTLLLVREVEHDFFGVGTYLARALVFAGRPAEALPVFEEMAGGPLGRPPRLALAYVMLGRRAEAEALAAEHADGLAFVTSGDLCRPWGQKPCA